MRCEQCGCTLFSCQCSDGPTNQLLDNEGGAAMKYQPEDFNHCESSALDKLIDHAQAHNAVEQENQHAFHSAFCGLLKQFRGGGGYREPQVQCLNCSHVFDPEQARRVTVHPGMIEDGRYSTEPDVQMVCPGCGFRDMREGFMDAEVGDE